MRRGDEKKTNFKMFLSNICIILPVIFLVVLIADGLIDREPLISLVFDKAGLSVPAQFTARLTDDLAPD